jgi:rRNA maturation endonuclease Nob1
MIQELQKIIQAKKPDKLDSKRKKAKMEMLQELKDSMGAMLSDNIQSLKKVTVAAPNKEGLEAGLEKAQEIVKKVPDEKEDYSKMSKEELAAAIERMQGALGSKE